MTQVATHLTPDEVKHMLKVCFPQLAVHIDFPRNKTLRGVRVSFNKHTAVVPIKVELTETEYNSVIEDIQTSFSQAGIRLLVNKTIFEVL